MKRAPTLLVTLALLVPAAGRAQELALRDRDQAGCDLVRGSHVAYLVPHRGIVLIASAPFPGGSALGAIRDGHFVGSLPGHGELRLSIEAANGTEIWGMLDESLDVGAAQGCFGFGPRRFSDIDDLKTYLHWWVEKVLSRLPEPPDGAVPAIWLGGRSVSIAVLSPTHRPLVLRGSEATTLGFEPEASAVRYYFQPFVLGEAGRSVAVRVSVKSGDFFGPGVAEEIAFVLIGPDEPTPLETDPPLALRLAGLETPVDFDR